MSFGTCAHDLEEGRSYERIALRMGEPEAADFLE